MQTNLTGVGSEESGVGGDVGPPTPHSQLLTPAGEQRLAELYEQPHSSRERHLGLMARGGFAAGVGSEESGDGGGFAAGVGSEESGDGRAQ